MRTLLRAAVLAGTWIALAGAASAQMPGGGPPAVGVITVTPAQIRATSEFNGRIEAIDRVNMVARVSAFLEERLFNEGADVRKGDLLFRLERAPYEAEVEAREAAVAQAQAQLDNANLAFERAEQLRKTGTGAQSTLDNAIAAQRTAVAQLRSAQAALRAAQINLDYTEIRSPIDGRIGRASVTAGNVVSPSSGSLVVVVSQDPMHVTFPVPTRRLIELQQEHAAEGGAQRGLRLRLRLPDGRLYDAVGELDFIDVSVATATDSVIVRGRIPNPVGVAGQRELFNDEFVRVILESIAPQQVMVVPRAAVMTDQQGDYVYVVGADKIARIQRVRLGQSTPGQASVLDGLSPGDTVIVEGVQRVRPQSPVDPQPARVLQAGGN